MRMLTFCCGAACILGVAAASRAEGPDLSYEEAVAASRAQEIRDRRAVTERLMQERAAFVGRQRVVRLQARDWLGVSLARPMYLNGNPVRTSFVAPWGPPVPPPGTSNLTIESP